MSILQITGEQLKSLMGARGRKRLAILIGAGVSRIAGCKSWDEMVEELLNLCGEKKENYPTQEIPAILGECKRRLNENFYQVVEKSVIPETEKLDKVYKPIMKILFESTNPVSVITTNIDSCLEMLKLFNGRSFDKDRLNPHELYMGGIFHLHGKNVKSAILTAEDYNNFYQNTNTTKFFLNNILGSYTLLIIGYSLREFELLKEFIFLNFLTPGDRRSPYHFVLFPSDEINPQMSELYKNQYGIGVISYHKRNESYSGFVDAIMELCEKLKPITGKEGDARHVEIS
ncbi:MAG TPA: hypothetical protein DHV62_10390 [Elusimicrobia bacterium]|jgi:hypothetical protein|nr:hypothetical protein [Elusimicrobiota bacterium]